MKSKNSSQVQNFWSRKFQRNFLGTEKIITILFLLVLTVFISGYSGCDFSTLQSDIQGGNFNLFGTTSNTAEKTGLDFDIDRSYMPTTIYTGQPFNIVVNLENYDLELNYGTVCVSDNIDDSFSGAVETCKRFFISEATETISEKKGIFGKEQKEITPGKTSIAFPSSEESFSYRDLRYGQSSFPGKIIVKLDYTVNSQITAPIKVSSIGDELQQQPIVTQNPAPLQLSISKKVDNYYSNKRIRLDITIKKIANYKIFSPDFADEKKIFFSANIPSKSVTCRTQGYGSTEDYDIYKQTNEFQTALLDFDNEKLIKCESVVSLGKEEVLDYPLMIDLRYGVRIEKEYGFSILSQQ